MRARIFQISDTDNPLKIYVISSFNEGLDVNSNPVIDASGNWVGPITNLKGLKGEKGDLGDKQPNGAIGNT